MNRAIIISKNQKASEYFEKFLIAHKIRDITHVSSSARARRLCSEQVFDFAIIVSPLPEETGGNLAKELALKAETQVMFFAKEELLFAGESELMTYGVITMAIPINRAAMEQGYKLAVAFSSKVKMIVKETKTMHDKLREIKKIDLAKCYIIEMQQKTEEEAHKTIERLAMDKRKTKLQIALEIIESYNAK